jgi:hypothetical protein
VRITNPYRQAPLWAAGTDPERLDIVERSFYAVAQSSPTRHVLASGPVNSGQVKVELVTPTGKPPFVVVTWPLKPSAMSPAAYSDGLTPWDRDGSRAGLAELDTDVQRDAYRRTDRLAAPGVHTANPALPLVYRTSGAGDEVVEDVANDFNSPIEGQDPKPISRRRDRFSHDRHLFHALLMLSWGSMFFEQLYRFDETANRFRLRKLAPRMPGSISEIQVH